MNLKFNRREFLQTSAAGGAVLMGASAVLATDQFFGKPGLVSPGCRGSKVKVARIFMGNPKGLWPQPNLDFEKKVTFYRNQFAKYSKELADVEFVIDELVTNPAQIGPMREHLNRVDGILVIHLSLGTTDILNEILTVKQPTIIFSEPYSGHEWTRFGALSRESADHKLDCILTSDYSQLVAAIRPFRAIHHMREAKVLNVTTRKHDEEYVQHIKEKFGMEIHKVGRQPVLDAYETISIKDAQTEADQWIRNAIRVVEPTREEIVKSCRLALAFQKMLDDEKATVITVDCYGSMYHQLPAFPCIGFTRLKDIQTIDEAA